MIRATDLVLTRAGRVVIDRVSFTAHSGSVTGVIGPNGSGKSSLLNALYRALTPTHGTVLIDGHNLCTMPRRSIARSVAVMAQHGDEGMPLRVRDAVMLGRLPHRRLTAFGNAEDSRLVDSALERVGARHLSQRLVTELSGGERQRVLVARAIVQEADHLLLDEPTNHLDLHHQFALLDLVASISASTIIVLHDLNLAARTCDQLILLDRGELVASGPTREVLDPALLSRVYGVNVDALEHRGSTHLVFSPAS